MDTPFVETDDKIPVTVLSGSLGAGKTTLVNHVLEEVHASDETVAVVVNDMGELNVDAELLETPVGRGDGGLLELSDGCICCQLQGKLKRQTATLAREHDFDHLLVESSGVSEPMPVAQAFISEGAGTNVYELDTAVTVVDAGVFWEIVEGNGLTDDVLELDTAETTKPIQDILMDQVEFADVLVVNKTDRISDEELGTVIDILGELKPGAEIIPTEFGRIESDDILGTGAFDTEETANAAGWIQRLKSDDGTHRGHDDEGHGHDHHEHEGDGHDHEHEGHDHDHEHEHEHEHEHRHPDERYGISSFVYRRSRPFHPRRLKRFLDQLPDTVVRAKGFVWLPDSNDFSVSLNVAAGEYRLTPAGKWIAALPDEKRDGMLDDNPVLREEWHPEHGDRGAQLVFIGAGMDRDALTDALDDCLLTDDEMAADWDGIENPIDLLPF